MELAAGTLFITKAPDGVPGALAEVYTAIGNTVFAYLRSGEPVGFGVPPELFQGKPGLGMVMLSDVWIADVTEDQYKTYCGYFNEVQRLEALHKRELTDYYEGCLTRVFGDKWKEEQC